MGAQKTPHQEQGEISELESKIIQQVEYYFGDYNLRRDRFLKEQLKLDNGWVPLEVMVKFNRLKILSDDIAVIASALKKSTNKLLEVSEDDTKIRRCADKPVEEFSAAVKTDLESRTIYCKRFPVTTTLDELLKFFNGFGNVETIYMKKKPNKTFKGSVLVTFVTREEAQNLLKLTNVKYNTVVLLMESKEAYSKRKSDEFQQRQLLKEKKQQMNAQFKKEAEEKQQSEKPDPEIKFTKGCILKLSGLSETTTKEDFYKVFAESQGDIAYLDYSRGQPEAHIRFSQGIAQSVLDKYSKKSGDDDKDDSDEKKDDSDDKKDDSDDKKDDTDDKDDIDDKDDSDDKKDDTDNKVDSDKKDDSDDKKDDSDDKKEDSDKDGDEKKEDSDKDGDDDKKDEEKDEKIDDGEVETEDKEQISCKTICINGVDCLATVLEGAIETEYWHKFARPRSDRKRQPYFKKGKGRFNPRTAGKDKFRCGKRGHWKSDRSSEKEKSDEVTEPPRKMMKTDRGNDSD